MERSCLVTIVLLVEPSFIYLIGDPDDLAVVWKKVVWKKVADQFEKKTSANKLVFRRILYFLKLKEGGSVHKHIKLMTEIFEELSVISDSIDEEDRVVHLPVSLPDSYDILATALEASQDVLMWASVIELELYE